jgi:hypothetical protein
MQITDPTTVAVVFTVLANAGLIGAMLGKFALLYTIIVKFSPSWQERIMRSIASVSGTLLYVGAKAFGLSIPVFLLRALTEGGALLTGAIGAMAPALVGYLCAWYLIRYLNSRNARRNLVGMRLLAMIMTIVLFVFADTYVAALHQADTLRTLMPNMAFALAVMLYAVLRYHPPADDPTSQAEVQAAQIIEAVRAAEKKPA